MDNLLIFGVVSIFNPISSYCDNISKLLKLVDYLIIMDDSDQCQRHVVERIITDNVEYEWNGKNLGLCKSINKGIKKAIDRSADWVLVMDQDSYPENDIVSVYRNYINKHDTNEVAILSPQLNYDRHPRMARSGVDEVGVAVLSGSLISSKAYKNVGPYDERCFIDGLDVEWCFRARKEKYKIKLCNEAVIRHHPGETRYICFRGKKLWGYGKSSVSRHYYQIRSGLMIYSLYHNKYSLFMLVSKIAKAFLIYDNRADYIKITIDAFKDHKNGRYGKYEKQ